MAEPLASLMRRRCLLGATEETTSGTAASVIAALTATSVYDAKLEIDDPLAQGGREPMGIYQGEIAGVPGQLTGTLTYTQQLRWGDVFIAMLTGCAFTGTPKARTSGMTSRKTFSFALWQDGVRKGLIGAAGTCKLTFKSGAPVTADWTWRGVWQAPIDEAMPATAPIVSLPYVARAMTFTYGSAVAWPHTGTIALDFGNDLQPREDVTKAGGVAHFYVADWKTRLTVDPEARLVAALDNYGLLIAGTEAAVSIVAGDGTHNLTIAVAKAQRRGVSDGDRGGVLLHNLELGCNVSTAGDDEITFAQA